ncbi:MAG: hypothetical protein HYR97_06140 [Candidatus Melainabacteria bacterium]|nr:hypothetical protein [Candidatus Melainabacteria bacterium]MBI3307807.1 hypothetical protein [Candidatus Melainabacteria bacterium]
MTVLSTINKAVKPVDVVEISASVPQDQVNVLRQMIFRYILDNNNEEVAYKLLNMSHTKLRDDIRIYDVKDHNLGE